MTQAGSGKGLGGAAVSMAILLTAALFGPWVCQAQTPVTATFGGDWVNHPRQHTCLVSPESETVNSDGLTLTANIGACSTTVKSTVQIKVVLSSPTITGVPTQGQFGGPPQFFTLSSPITITVTASVTVTSGKGQVEGSLNGGTIGLTGVSNQNQCSKPTPATTSATMTCTVQYMARDSGTATGRLPQDFVSFDYAVYDGSANYSFSVAPQFTEGGAAPDSISLSNVTPTASTLAAQSSQQFTGTAQYTLNSVATGTVTLELSDQNNNLVGASTAVAVSKGASTTPLTIPAVTLPASGSLTLKAVLRPASGAATSSTAVTYTIGANATISLNLAKPADPLSGLAAFLPPFCGSGQYTYSGSHQGQVRLELLDSKGNFIAKGQMVNIPNGNNQSWGGACKDPKQLVYIAEQAMPSFPFPPSTPSDKVLGTLYLQATLFDSVTGPLATSNQVPYNVVPGISATSRLELVKAAIVGGTDAVPVDTSRILLFAYFDGPTGSMDLAYAMADSQSAELKLVVTLDSAGAGGLLDANVVVTDGAQRPLDTKGCTLGQVVSKGHNEIRLKICAFVSAPAAKVSITPRFTSDGGQVILLDPIVLTLDSIAMTLTPDPGKCVISSPGSCLVVGQTNTILAQLAITPVVAGEVYQRIVRSSGNTSSNTDGSQDPLPLAPAPALSQINSYVDTFQARLPPDATRVEVLYRGGSRVGQAYTAFTTPLLVLAANAKQQTLNLVGGILNNVANSTPARQVRNLKTNVSLVQKFGNIEDDWLKGRLGSEQAAGAPPPFIPIQTSWQFDPPIPHDGSFSASMSLNYTAADLPTDPNFAESKLQVVSIDASGGFRAYQTTLDLANKTATAQIDGLDPYYSLAVVGPFTQTPVLLASQATGYALVNTGTQSSNVNVTAYTADGTATPSSSTLKAGNQQKATGLAWVQSWSNPSTVAGVSFFDNGSQFAVNPSGPAGQAFVLTDVEYDTRISTEVDIANATAFAARTTITLYGSDAGVQGTYTATLAARASLSLRIEGVFPSIKPGFRGYATVGSLQPVAVSGYRWTNTTAAGLMAQPVTVDSLALRTWYAPQLAGSGLLATLHVVNTASKAANVTLKAFSTSGSPAAASVSVRLAAGQQYSKAVSDIFGIDPSTAGSIEVDSDTNGVFGDVLTLDASFTPLYAVSIPLSAQPLTSSVLPYATANTTVLVFNPNASSTNVAVTPYGPDGTAGKASSATIAAFGRASITASAAAYAGIASSQPVVAAGWIAVPSGTTAGYLALASSAPAGNPGGGSPLTISPGGITNAAAVKTTLARGALGTLYWSGYSGSPVVAQSLPLPYSLGGVSVTVGGVPAPLYYVDPGQINFQVPAAVPAGSAALVVVSANGVTSPAVSVAMADYAVALFSYFRTASSYDPIVVHAATNALVSPANPATPGETLVAYATGAGKLNNPPPDAAPAGASTLTTTVDKPTATVGGLPAPVLFAGLTPGLVGVLQLNITLPSSLPSGNLPLIVSLPGDQTPTVNLAVQGNVASAPKLTLSANTLAFGSLTVGQTKDLSLTVSNTGTAALSVTSSSVTGAGFSLTTASSFTVQPGASQTVTVRYAPAAAGTSTGTLTIASNDSASPATVSLSGTATAPAPAPIIKVTPTSLDYGAVAPGQTKDLFITVFNNGTTVLTVNTITSDNPRFGLASAIAVPFRVGEFGGYQLVNIRFSPTSTAPQSGTLTINSTDPATPNVTIPVTGNR